VHIAQIQIPEAGAIVRAGFTYGHVGQMNNWTFGNAAAQAAYPSLAELAGIEMGQIVRTHQLHTTNVRIVDSRDAGMGVCWDLPEEGYDGLITNVPGLVLCTVEADCVPVYMVDIRRKVIAMLHSGWKGTAGQISAEALQMMQQAFGTQPEDVSVVLGPHVCADCYEVDDSLIEPFASVYNDEQMKQLFVPNGKPQKYQLDLSKAIMMTLARAGVQEHRIIDCGHCTHHEPQLCSWRRDHLKGDLMLTGLMLV